MPPKTPVIVEPGPAGGWGSVGGMAKVAWREHTDPSTLKTLMEQNRPHGFACVSCAWTKPAEAKLFEFCENGAKATLWEATPLRCTPAFRVAGARFRCEQCGSVGLPSIGKQRLWQRRAAEHSRKLR
jgi:hypothetical protein